ncbi:MAG: ERCC4 domain-containing protein, partial [Candidatus Thorarchaeota archaeon]
YVDDREPDIMLEKIKSFGIQAKKVRLPIGDYIIGDELIVERKTIDDFFNSIMERRYYPQLYRMKDFKRPIVYITGVYPKRPPQKRVGKDLVPIDIEKELRIHRIISYYSFRIPVIHVASDDDFIKDLLEFHRKSLKTEPSLKPLKPKRGVTNEEIRIEMLGCIPGLGRKIANYLGRTYTIAELCEMTEDELCDIVINNRRLGKKGKKIYEVLRGE